MCEQYIGNKQTTLFKFDFITMLISAYLINMVHIKWFSSIQQLLIWGAVALYLSLNGGIIISLFQNNANKRFGITTILLIGICLLFLGVPVLYKGDYTYMMQILKMFLLFAYYMVIVVRIKKRYPNRNIFDSFIQVYIYSNVLYVIFTILMICFPSIKNIVLNCISINDFQLRLLNNPYYATRIGWTGFSGYNSSMKCTISCCFALFLIAKNIYENKRNSILLYGLLIILLIGNIFYARTGAIFSAVCVVVSLFSVAIKQKKIKKFAKYVLVLLVILIAGYFAIQKLSEDNLSVRWAFEGILNYFESGEFTTTSQDSLEKMYFMPSFKTFILGDGQYTSSSGYYYMNTDVGFMRLLLYGGIFGASSIYLVALRGISAINIGKKAKYNILPILMMITLIGFELKGESILILIPLFIIMGILIGYSYIT